MDNKQVIEGGELLNSIAQLLFKGLNNLMDTAAEYEEEMGVLKQVTTIPFKDKKGNDYFLKIKLSPIKDKENLYYVEAETNNKDFDISSISEKTVTLNNKTKTEFNNMVKQLFIDNNFEVDKSKTSEDKSDSSPKVDENIIRRISDWIKEASEDDSIQTTNAATESGEAVKIDTQVRSSDTSETECKITIATLDHNDNIYPDADKLYDVIDLSDIESYEDFVDMIDSMIESYAENNKLTISDEVDSSMKVISATFIKSSHDGRVRLTAINASCNIEAALDIIDDVVSYDDFVEGLQPDVEQSFTIMDNGQNYNVEKTERVDTSSTYDILFKSVSMLLSKLETFEWALGSVKWAQNPEFDSIRYQCFNCLSEIAPMMVQHTDHYPCTSAAYTCYPTLDEFKDEQGNLIQIEMVSSILDDVQELIQCFNDYRVNLTNDEQVKLDLQIAEFNRILAYA